MTKRIIWLMGAFFIFFLSAIAPALRAQDNLTRLVSYQGVLSIGTAGSSGPLLNGEYKLTFRIYTDSLAQSRIWAGTYNTTVQDGVFSVLLGAGDTPLPTPQEMDRPLWIGVQVEQGQEMRPLAQLTASPFALNVVDGAITTHKIARGAVTADKVAFNYLKQISINGTPIPGQAKTINLQSANGVDLTYDDATSTLSFGASKGVWTPEPLYSNADNYQLESGARYVRLLNSNTTSIDFTGLDRTSVLAGRVVSLINIGTSPIVIKNRSALSAPENQFIVPGGTDIILIANGMATFQYDDVLHGWFLNSAN
ncbi:MAG: hypothetical protein Q8922_03375 [Bacteroidota bacterium]|nr:hypothetical protein [Bacteroidota bacterium]MDP4233331.1 hypothetical protein [Bacteroidota bacterium]MDP4244185.1 hypothetical protein [Bacteroidota bacterium]MDP4286954.1 hypothetical protein [Bacteroidota bacterium]